MDKVIHFEIPVDDAKRAQDFYKNIFGWKPEVSFKQLVEMMVDADLAKFKSIKRSICDVKAVGNCQRFLDYVHYDCKEKQAPWPEEYLLVFRQNKQPDKERYCYSY